MKAFYTLKAGDEEYKLRLTASSLWAIEKKLGKSLFTAFDSTQDNMIEIIITILWGAMQPLNANYTFEEATAMFDQYIDDGNTIEDLMREINSLFEVSGFFKKGQVKK